MLYISIAFLRKEYFFFLSWSFLYGSATGALQIESAEFKPFHYVDLITQNLENSLITILLG